MGLRTLVVVAVAVALGLVLLPRESEQVWGSDSSCGPVDLHPEDLPLDRTRELTLCLLNEERAAHGLAPVVREPRLELASQRHSEDMVARRFFEHDAPGGVDPQQRMLAARYPSNNAITGENIAAATGPRGSPAGIVDLWMHSPPHRENILRPEFTQVGVGIAPGAPEPSRGPAATYTTDFGGPPVR